MSPVMWKPRANERHDGKPQDVKLKQGSFQHAAAADLMLNPHSQAQGTIRANQKGQRNHKVIHNIEHLHHATTTYSPD